MGYSDDEAMVRVDFFKPKGKWYCTEAVKWTGEWSGDVKKLGKACLIHEAFKQSLRDHFKYGSRLEGMDAICLEPYHENSHPIIIKAGER